MYIILNDSSIFRTSRGSILHPLDERRPLIISFIGNNHASLIELQHYAGVNARTPVLVTQGSMWNLKAYLAWARQRFPTRCPLTSTGFVKPSDMFLLSEKYMDFVINFPCKFNNTNLPFIMTYAFAKGGLFSGLGVWIVKMSENIPCFLGNTKAEYTCLYSPGDRGAPIRLKLPSFLISNLSKLSSEFLY